MAIPTFTGRQLRGFIPTIVTYAVLAIVVYLLFRLVRKGVRDFTSGIGDFLNTNAQEQLDSTEAQDGTTMTNEEQNAFKPIAKQVADGQEFALYQTNLLGFSDPDEDALFMPLLDYNGAQLREIYGEYGQRRGRTLFEAYQDKLKGGLSSMIYYDERIQGCESYFDQCDEVEAGRGIWQKSGIPLTF